jgi:hypothetical protein
MIKLYQPMEKLPGIPRLEALTVVMNLCHVTQSK